MVHHQHSTTPIEVSVLVVQDLRDVQAYRLDRLLLTVGRSKQADIQIVSQEVSRIHATLLRVRNRHGDPQYRLIDGDARQQKPSQNGIYVNGERVRSCDLKNRDEIVFCRRSKARFFQFNSALDADLAGTPERWDKPAGSRAEEYETTTSNTEEALQQAQSLGYSSAMNPEEFMALRTNPPVEPTAVFQQNRFKKHSRLGELLVRANKIKPEILQTLLSQQQNTKKRLGELLLDQAILSPDELRKALRNQKICLGEILLNRQLITAEQLTMALVEQVSNPGPLGSILLKWDWIKAKELEDALQEQYLRHKGLWFIQ